MERHFTRTLSDGRAGLADLTAAIEAFLEQAAVPEGVAVNLMVAFDEVLSNVLVHGRQGGAPSVEISVTVGDGAVSAEVSDDGAAFDPLSVPPPDTALSIEDRPIGGLGILLVRKLMTEVTYRRESGRNRLRFSKDFPVGQPN